MTVTPNFALGARYSASIEGSGRRRIFRVLVGVVAIFTCMIALPSAELAKAQPRASGKVLPDVLGIKLGMTQAEVSDILKKLYPSLQIQQEQTIINGLPQMKYISSVGVELLNGTRAVSVEALFAAPPNEHRVFYIEQRSWVPENEAPLESVVIDSLEKKYGPTLSGADVMGAGSKRYLWWAWTASGSIAPNPIRPIGPCGGALGLARTGVGDPRAFDSVTIFAHDLKAGCTTEVAAELQSYKNGVAQPTKDGDGVVRNIFTEAVDVDALVADLNNTGAYVAQLEHTSQENERQKATGIVPKL